MDILSRAAEIIEKNTALCAPVGAEPYCVLALIDENGTPTASAITAAKSEGLKWIAFCSGLESNKAKRAARCDRASVCFCAADYNITLTGHMEIVTDEAVKREMWYDGLQNHFQGPDDPGYCVLRFHTERYNLLVDWQEAWGSLES